MSTLAYVLGAVILVSFLSLIGVVSLAVSKKRLQNIVFGLVSFAAGSLLSAAFLDLIPEALERATSETVFFSVIAGIAVFFVLETFLYWYHSHEHEHAHPHKHLRHRKKKPMAYLNLIGDGVHNFLDGVIIATSFLASVPIGIVASLAIVFHEIPQEIGDFGILVYSGFTRARALLFNFLSALTAVVGALIAYYLGTIVQRVVEWLLPFAAGGFVYIATVDLLPELRKTLRLKRSFTQLGFFALGIFVMWVVTRAFAH